MTRLILRLMFSAGASNSAPPLEVDPGALTVVVGPNGCGKSTLLREVEQRFQSPQSATPGVLRDVAIAAPAANDLIEYLRELKTGETDSAYTFRRQLSLPLHGNRKQWPEPAPHQLPKRNVGQLGAPAVLSHLHQVAVLRLDGPTRLMLSHPQPMGNLTQPPCNHLSSLFRDDDLRAELRVLMAAAVGRHFTLDALDAGWITPRLAPRPPADVEEERSLTERSIRFHQASMKVEDAGDGLRAFTGILSAVLAIPYKVVLLDEAEAFLHPPLARELGFRLATICERRNANLLVATHSPHFLMGVVEAGKPANVIRLTYGGAPDTATARHLSGPRLSTLLHDPLLRSTGTLGGLFHQAVVVTESDTDRAFYDEINHRLRRGNEGCRDTLFLNAQNKQTVQRLITPLRELGVPAAAIVDLDVIKEGGANWTNLLKSAGVPEAIRRSLEALRPAVKQRFDDAGLNPKRDGLDKLPTQGQREECEQLLTLLAQYGIFVVPVGEVENWLPSLGVPTGLHGPPWLMEAFNTLGSDPADSGYMQAGPGDVWAFLRKIAAWVGNPHRKGVPEG